MVNSLDRALAMAREWVGDGIVPGVAMAVMHRGDLAGEVYNGKQAAGAGRPVDATTLYSGASVTKPFTAAAFMHLVDRGWTRNPARWARMSNAVGAMLT